MSVEIANESGMDVDETLLVSAAEYAIQAMDVHPAAELAMTLVDLDTMEQLHIQWLDLEGPTDVMSFPMDELTPGGRPDSSDPGPAMLGDIVLCPQFATDQAKRAGNSPQREMGLLTIHGVLHLLGYDHATPAEEKEMFHLQNVLLEEWWTAYTSQQKGPAL